MKRKIVLIDEEKCTGCGDCIPKCHEGALQIINGKAKLVAEKFCDGIGDCLGSCPFDAIRVKEEEVSEDYDEEAVKSHLEGMGRKFVPRKDQSTEKTHSHSQGGCPSALSRQIDRKPDSASTTADVNESSQLTNWPVQISLAAPQAPYFNNSHILIAADCVPFAYAGFHSKFLKDKILLIGCPKLDDAQFYREKLTDIFKKNDVKNISIAHMEVPCCFSLEQIVTDAIRESGKDIPLGKTIISVDGKIL